jgi:hypothetical protein
MKAFIYFEHYRNELQLKKCCNSSKHVKMTVAQEVADRSPLLTAQICISVFLFCLCSFLGHHDTASSSSPMSQQGTGPVNKHHGVHSSKVRQHSAPSVRKRPHTQTGSDTKHFAGVSKCKTQK